MAQNEAQIVDFDPEEQTEKIRFRYNSPAILQAAYDYCAVITKDHYENFPVASVIMPKHMRPAIEAVYAFSRLADDFADEKEYQNVRMQRLAEWQQMLQDEGQPTHPVFIALHDARRQFHLPEKLFLDLLTAYRMDVSTSRYQDFTDVMHYCAHSANPVGRLVLHLFKQDTAEHLQWSDYICTALQLTNFWQDVAIDLQKDRIYLPHSEMQRFSVTEDALYAKLVSKEFKRLMAYQMERTRALFLKGKPLGLHLPGRLGIEIRLTWLTGMMILKRLVEVDYDVFHKRPKLKKSDFFKLFFVALSRKRFEKWEF